MNPKANQKRWLISYIPGDSLSQDHELVGTRDEADTYFFEHCLCKWCREEIITGVTTYLNADGSVYETHEVAPYSISPWATGCGAEYDLIEITEDGRHVYATNSG